MSWEVCPECALVSDVSIHVLRRGRCVAGKFGNLDGVRLVSIHVLRRGRCVVSLDAVDLPPLKFQSTSSEEDVVSFSALSARAIRKVSIHVLRRGRCVRTGHNTPRDKGVSIHVLRRGRCVPTNCGRIALVYHCFNPRPPKRTLCLTVNFHTI